MVTGFDRDRASYEAAVERAISFSGADHQFFIEAKAERLLELAARRIGSPERLNALDVGCGAGLTDRFLTGRFGDLAGTDVSQTLLQSARAENPSVRYELAEPERLPFADASFDLSFAICVLHHVEVPDRARFVTEMRRVTRPGGLVVVFEHNPWNPLTRVVVRNCEFDDGVELIGRRELSSLLRDAGLPPVESSYLLFFPWRSRVLRRAERGLDRVPFGAQYVVAGRRA
jgi:SAM-dependent methyltransferase